MNKREIAKALRVCDKDHGGPHNSANLYGHAVRTCIRLRESGAWVYDPAWEKR